MPDDPVVNDHLRRLAQAYFSRLTSRPAPIAHVVGEFRSVPQRSWRELSITAGVASFLVIAELISYETFNHRLDLNHAASSSPPAPSLSSTSAATSMTSSPTATAANPVTAAVCTTSQLQISYLGVQGGAGNVQFDFELRDAGPVACELEGWPGVRLLSATGERLSTSVTKTTSIGTGTAQQVRVILLAGLPLIPSGSASSGYAYLSIEGDDVLSDCESAAGIAFSLPGEQWDARR